MNSAGVTPRVLHQSWQWGIEMDGFNASFFVKGNLPGVTFPKEKFKPAGSVWDTTHAGRPEFKDVKLEKGVPQGSAAEEDLMNWVRACITIAATYGGVPGDYQRDVDLVRYDRKGKETHRFRLHSAWPSVADFGEMDGGSSANTMETLTLTYNHFDIIFDKGSLSENVFG